MAEGFWWVVIVLLGRGDACPEIFKSFKSAEFFLRFFYRFRELFFAFFGKNSAIRQLDRID